MDGLKGVHSVASGGRIAAVRGRRDGGAQAFVVHEETTVPATRASVAAGEVALGMLLSLQDEAEPARDRAARQHGRALLAELHALHVALLGDYRKFKGLHVLMRLICDPPETAADPLLAAALEEVTLRARVELARYGAPAEN